MTECAERTIAADMHIPMTLATVRDLHVAYTVDKMIAPDRWEAIFAGSCRLDALPALDTARANSMFRDLVGPYEALRVTILHIDQSEHLASVYAWKPAATAVCNTHGTQLAPAGSRRVKCVDDGMEFDNASQAARHYGVSASSIYNCLNNRKYFKTVGGRRFIRI